MPRASASNFTASRSFWISSSISGVPLSISVLVLLAAVLVLLFARVLRSLLLALAALILILLPYVYASAWTAYALTWLFSVLRDPRTCRRFGVFLSLLLSFEGSRTVVERHKYRLFSWQFQRSLFSSQSFPTAWPIRSSADGFIAGRIAGQRRIDNDLA